MMNNLKNIRVDLKKKYQIFEGFGTTLSWWANIVGNWNMIGASGQEVREELMNLIFDIEDGLGMNIVRYNIGGGENPDHHHVKRIEARVPGYKLNEDSEYDYEIDRAQLWVLQRAKEIIKQDLIVEAFSMSPPWWMTYSNCSSGHEDKTQDNLKSEYYEAFAKYLVDVCLFIHDKLNIEIDYLEPVNEPEADYWEAFSTKQEGCHFSTGRSQSRIYELTFEALKSVGLEKLIKLTGLDETSIDMTIDQLKHLSPEALEVIYKINTHAYGGDKRAELCEQVKKLDKKLWMSEVCVGDGNHDHHDMKTALDISRIIIKDLKELQAEAWIMWQAIESEVENIIHNGCWGFIHAVFEEQDDLDPIYHKNLILSDYYLEKGNYFLTKQYYAFAQFSKYVRPGYQFIEIDHEKAIAAYGDRDNRLVIVVVNDEANNQHLEIELPNHFKAIRSIKIIRTSPDENLEELQFDMGMNQTLSIEVISRSVTTMIIEYH